MSRLVIALAALLLAACAVPPGPPPVTQDARPLSPQAWQSLQSALRDAPAQLQQALAVQARSQLTAQTSRTEAASAASAPGVLFDLLVHADQPALLPDEAFQGLSEVVSGNKRPPHAYATALTDYLLDPDFACRQPLYAGYFQRRYAGASGAVSCRRPAPFSVLTRYQGAQVTWLDPRRVQAIHLLFAGQSGEMASRFGHVALRLVVCPEGNDAPEACDANLFEHLVLGFQAHIDDFSLNTLKALAGDYQAYLFANPFMDVYEQYAIGEFREVYSLPLKLDPAQREGMVHELADIHWRYAGRYNFFTRNCATILQDALRQSWQTYASDAQLQDTYLRPDRLFEALRRSALADGRMLDDLDLAERTGHYFSSTRIFYERALAQVRAAMQQPEFTDLDAYLKITPVRRGASMKADAQFAARLASNAHLREAQIMLEEYAVLRSMRALMMEAARYFDQQDLLARSASLRQQLDSAQARVLDDCLLTPIRQQIRPLHRLGGVPARADLLDAAPRASHCESTESRTLLLETLARIGDPDSEQWQQLVALSRYSGDSIKNINDLKSM